MSLRNYIGSALLVGGISLMFMSQVQRDQTMNLEKELNSSSTYLLVQGLDRCSNSLPQPEKYLFDSSDQMNRNHESQYIPNVRNLIIQYSKDLGRFRKTIDELLKDLKRLPEITEMYDKSSKLKEHREKVILYFITGLLSAAIGARVLSPEEKIKVK